MNQEVTEYKFDKATVRIHGTADYDKITKAATDFLKKVEFQRRKAAKNEEVKKECV